MIRIIVDKKKMPMLHEYLSFILLTAKNIKEVILAVKYNNSKSQVGWIRYELIKYENYQWENYYDSNRYGGDNWNMVIANDIINKLCEYLEGAIGEEEAIIKNWRLQCDSIKKIENRISEIKNIHKYNPYAIGTICECAEMFLLESDLKRLVKKDAKKDALKTKEKENTITRQKKYGDLNQMKLHAIEIKKELKSYKSVIKLRSYKKSSKSLPSDVLYGPTATLIHQLEEELKWIEKEIAISTKKTITTKNKKE